MNAKTTPVKSAAVEARAGSGCSAGRCAAKAAANGALIADQMTDEQRAAVTQDWCDDFIAAAKSCRATITRSVPSWVNAHTAMRLLRAAGAQCYGTERSVTVVSVAISEEATKRRSDEGAKERETQNATRKQDVCATETKSAAGTAVAQHAQSNDRPKER